MPNTLGHLGFQALATRSLAPDADLKWICLGAVLPDVPWILQRAVAPLARGDGLLDLKLYTIAQASLGGCLLLAGAVALVSARPARVFGLLALNAFLHLLLDATQARWGAGVHLLAPLSWRSVGLGLYWPESIVSLVLTLTGLVLVLLAWRYRPGEPVPLSFASARRVAAATLLVVVYLSAPLAVLDGAEAADVQSVRTLREREARTDRPLGLIRTSYVRGPQVDLLDVVTGEQLIVRGRRHARSATVSIRGRFIDPRTVEIAELHAHWPGFRDLASYVGLALTALVWWRPLLLRRRDEKA